MGFFDSKPQHTALLPWRDITLKSDLEEVVRISASQPVILFKHSTRCGISRMVLRQFEARGKAEGRVYFFLDLPAHRPISDEVAVRFGVQHQSPQVLVIERGVCTRSASHHDILNLML